MIGNFLSGIIGAILGAASSVFVAIYANKQQVKSIARERQLNLLTEGLFQTSKLLDMFRYYKPKMLSSSNFGLKLDSEFEFKIRESIIVLEDFRRLTHLMPFELRTRWIETSNLLKSLGDLEFATSEQRDLAESETRNYISYLYNSILDLIENRELREEASIPVFDGKTLYLEDDI